MFFLLWTLCGLFLTLYKAHSKQRNSFIHSNAEVFTFNIIRDGHSANNNLNFFYCVRKKIRLLRLVFRGFSVNYFNKAFYCLSKSSNTLWNFFVVLGVKTNTGIFVFLEKQICWSKKIQEKSTVEKEILNISLHHEKAKQKERLPWETSYFTD